MPTMAAAAAPRAKVLYIQPPAGRRGSRHIRIRPAWGALDSRALTRSASPAGAGRLAISRRVSSPVPEDSRRFAWEESPLFERVFIADSLGAGAGQPSGYGRGTGANARSIR